jgi:hypothetical protein
MVTPPCVCDRIVSAVPPLSNRRGGSELESTGVAIRRDANTTHRSDNDNDRTQASKGECGMLTPYYRLLAVHSQIDIVTCANFAESRIHRLHRLHRGGVTSSPDESWSR